MTEIEKVRLRIGDLASAVFALDAYIQEFLDANGGDVFLASADACRTMATSGWTLDKAEEIANYKLDRKGLIKSLLAAADAFTAMSANVPAYGFYEQAHSDLSARDIVYREALRDQG